MISGEGWGLLVRAAFHSSLAVMLGSPCHIFSACWNGETNAWQSGTCVQMVCSWQDDTTSSELRTKPAVPSIKTLGYLVPNTRL